MGFAGILFLTIIAALVYALFRARKTSQLAYIDKYQFHSAIRNKLSDKYPHLSPSDVNLVFDGLREYFHICHKANKRMVAMPSQAVDIAWHEFILFTKAYDNFCQKALGRFLHHTPTEAMKTATLAQDGIKRAWRLSCAKNGINPATPSRLPLLFEIDSRLNIPDGFKYSLNCRDKSSPNYADGYCAGHISCGGGCGGSSGGSSDSGGGFFSDSGDSGGCSSGCGGGD